MFLFKKTFIENSNKKSEKHFWSHRKEFYLDFSTKVAGCRAVLYPLYVQSIALAVPTRLLWRHAVVSIREVVNGSELNKALGLGIEQQVEQIRANVFYSTFLNFFILSRFLRYLTVFF